MKACSLGRYLTTIDAELFAIRMAVQIARSSMLETEAHHAEILSNSGRALSAVDGATGRWTAPAI